MVYVVKELKTHTNYLKIGVAIDPSHRLTHLQIGNRRPLAVIHMMMTDADYELEAHLHGRFALKRCDGGGEWFDIHLKQIIRYTDAWAKKNYRRIRHIPVD